MTPCHSRTPCIVFHCILIVQVSTCNFCITTEWLIVFMIQAYPLLFNDHLQSLPESFNDTHATLYYVVTDTLSLPLCYCINRTAFNDYRAFLSHLMSPFVIVCILIYLSLSNVCTYCLWQVQNLSSLKLVVESNPNLTRTQILLLAIQMTDIFSSCHISTS